jgi:hypothetical protein
VQIAGFDGGVKSWPWWHATQLAPSCTPVSTRATLAWQLVQAATFASGSPCGMWQPMHAPWAACVTWTVEWHPWHEAAAAAGACGAWQVVQLPWAGAVSAARVGFIPWHPTHAEAPPAANSWGLWHPMHES